MMKIARLIALVGFYALAAGAAVPQTAPSAAKQWNVNNTDNVSYETDYELYNKTTQLGYEDRTFGINLGWVGHSGGHFAFLRKAPAGVRDRRIGPVGENENVAIWNTKVKRYLYYYKRGDAKAELEWGTTPMYEWQIQDQSASGSRVHFALFNDRVNKYLVYQVKNYGINLGWHSQGAPASKSISIALNAKQITQGWVPYGNSFGQNTRGNLLTVQNASQSATLMFVKPGKSTTDCSDPTATLRVAPKAFMTPDQVKTLYGAATPRLPINFLACLTTPTNQSISLTFINITYKLDQ